MPIDPGYDRLGADISRGLQSGVSNFMNIRQMRQNNARQAKIDVRGDEQYETQLFGAGYRRGTAPTQERDIFEGMDDDLIPPFAAPAGPVASPQGFRLDGGRGIELPFAQRLGMAAENRAPDLLLDTPRFDRPRPRAMVTETAPGYQQINDDLFMDQSATPEARRAAFDAARRGEERDYDRETKSQDRQRIEDSIYAALGGMPQFEGASPERLRATARAYSYDPGSIDRLIADSMKPVEPVQPVRGSPEALKIIEAEEDTRGRARARHRAPPRGGAGGGSGDDGDPVARRQLVLNAVAAVNRVSRGDFDDGRGNIDTGAYHQAQREAAGTYGFQSMQELSAAARKLGETGPGGESTKTTTTKGGGRSSSSGTTGRGGGAGTEEEETGGAETVSREQALETIRKWKADGVSAEEIKKRARANKWIE